MSVFYSELGYQSLNQLLEYKRYSKIFVLTDTNTNKYCSPIFLAELETYSDIELVEIPEGEEQKNIQTCVEIWNILNDLGADRKSLLIGLGGGVVTDIGGFVASVYKRGIDFVNVPTSLLGMVDAAIGGKNGVDLGELKNQIGTITEPEMILIDFRFLETLPNVQIRSGYAEMLKHGLIQDKNYWQQLADFKNIDFSDIDELIIRSIQIKTNITNNDLTEEGLRKALNFGHTLGHAIESYCLNNAHMPTLLHGEAIAIGMVLESYISYKKQYILLDEYLEIKSVFDDIYPKVKFNITDIQTIIKLMSFDKKNERGKVLFVLLDRIGSVHINQVADETLIIEAFIDYNLEGITNNSY